METSIYIEEGIEGCLEEGWLENIAEQVAIAQGIDSETELSLVIVGQERIRQLNRQYLEKDAPTDVLAFPMLPEQDGGGLPAFVTPPGEKKHLGEVIVCYPQAVTQAEEQKHSTKREVAILIVHGVLHLLGYDHDGPEAEKEMRAREAEILSSMEEELA